MFGVGLVCGLKGGGLVSLMMVMVMVVVQVVVIRLIPKQAANVGSL